MAWPQAAFAPISDKDGILKYTLHRTMPQKDQATI